MANLKLIKVTGKPFSDASIGKIGIQRSNYQFDIIREGTLYSQESSYGNGWEYATAEEIKENWAAIYPHWTPEVGDNVIVTQDYGGWVNCKGTICEKDNADDYYRVESETGRSCIFDYTRQMILAPYSETTIEPKKETKPSWKWQDLEIGDKVKIIGGDFSSRPVGSIFAIDKMEAKDYGGRQPIRLVGSDGEDKGWPYKDHFEPYYGDVVKPKEETVTIRFLTEQQFKDQSLWIDDHPKGWNSDGHMNKYLGQSVVIPKSIIGSDGTFRYQDWTFKVTDYIVTEGVSSSESVSSPVIDTKPEKRSLKVGDDVIAKGGPFNNVLGKIKEIREGRFGVEFCERRVEAHHLNNKCETGYGWYYAEHELILTDDSIRRLKTEKPLRRFKVGDEVTYKSLEQCGGDYKFGGNDQGGFVGTVEHEGEYEATNGCYNLRVSTKDGFCFNMLECEFCEYDGTTITKTLHIHKTTTNSFTIQDVIDRTGGTTLTYGITPTFSGHVDPLSLYKQKPITIKSKPKSKLTII